MWPVVLEWDGWRLRSYDIVLVLAIILGIWLSYKRALWYGFPPKKMALFILGVIACALIGARINGWLFWYSHDVSALSLDITATHHGMTAFGGIAGAVLFTTAFAIFQRWNRWRLLDVMVPVMVLCEALQRFGCLLNGCCYGELTSSSLGFYLPDSLGIWANRFPSQIFTGVWCAILYLYLRRLERSGIATGEIFLQYMILYPAGRLLLDFLRGDEPTGLGVFSVHQVASLIMIVIGGFLIYWRNKQLSAIVNE